MESLTNPHDRFFKESFSRLETARDFVRHYLPADVTALLNLDTLKITKDSFINEKLKERFSDLVYQVDLKQDGYVYVYLLFEHKSYPEPEVALYLLSCMVHLWHQCLKQKKHLPLPGIIPLVVYHGREKWNISRAFEKLVFTPDPMKPFVPRFSYHLWDLSHYTEDEIKGGVFLKVTALLLKHIFSEDMGERLPGIFKLFERIINGHSGLQFVEAALRYISSGSTYVEKADIARALKVTLDEEGEDIMSTLAEQWIDEGFQKGMLREARENVLEAIASRFNRVPDDIAREVENIHNRAFLKLLLRQAVVCTDLEVFRKTLNEQTD